MTLIQVTYYVPDDMWANLVAGTMKRFGSVVRDSHQITAHLKEIKVEEVTKRAVDAVANQNAGSIARSVGLGLIGIGIIATTAYTTYYFTKKAQEKAVLQAQEMPEELKTTDEASEAAKAYNDALVAYVDSIKSGELTGELVSNLSKALDRVQEDAESGAIKLELSAEHSEALVAIVADYTQKLAEANSFDSSSVEVQTDDKQNPVVQLRHYLEVQKQIIEKAA